MSDTNTTSEMNPTQDDFAALLEQSFAEDNPVEGSVVEGRITAIENDLVIIDVGIITTVVRRLFSRERTRSSQILRSPMWRILVAI